MSQNLDSLLNARCTTDPFRLIKGLKPEKEALLKSEINGLCDVLGDSNLMPIEKAMLAGNRMRTLDETLGAQTWRPAFAKTITGEGAKELILLPLDSKHCSNILLRADQYYADMVNLKQKPLEPIYQREVGRLPVDLQLPYGHWQDKVPVQGDVASCLRWQKRDGAAR